MKKSILGIVAIVVMMAVVMAGCPSPTTDDKNGEITFAIGVYIDSVQDGFKAGQDSGGGADKVIVTLDHTEGSETAVKVDLDESITDWGGFYFAREAGSGPVDISGKVLKFSILKSSIDSTPALSALDVKMEDSQGGSGAPTHNYAIDLLDTKFTRTESGDWYKYSIPVSEFGQNEFDPTDFNGLGFWNPMKDDGSGTNVIKTGTMFIIDNIGFDDATAYTVTYNGNGSDGGTLSKTTESITDGGTIPAAPTGITKTGYTLSGWNTQADGGGTDFVFDTTTVTGDITLYAQWEMVVAFTGILFDDALQNGFAVGVDSDGDAAIDATEATTVAGTSGKSIKISQSSGSWGGGFVQNTNGVDASSYTKIQFSINVASLDSGVDYLEVKLEDTVPAAYSVNLYALTADSTDGDWNTYSIALSAAAGVDLTKFKSIGFWHPRAGGVNGTFTPGTFYVDDIKFNNEAVAQHTVTYHANPDGKTLVGSLSKTSEQVNSGATIASAPDGISITGYTLKGWNTESDGNGHDFVFGATPVYSDMTLYAQWEMDVVFTGTIFDDAVSDALDAPTMWNGSNGFAISVDTTEKNSGTSSLKLDWSSATDWNSAVYASNSGTVDVSSYNAITFWAKASAQETIQKFGFGNLTTNLEAWIADQVITTTWTKYIVPLPNPAKLTAITTVFYVSDNSNGIIYLDDVKYETVANLAVKTFQYNGQGITVNKDGTATIADLAVVFTDGTNDIANAGAKLLRAHATWVSGDTGIATVDANGEISGVADGTVTITGTLGGKDATISVTVQTPAAFDGVIFADALQNGFAARQLYDTGSETDATIDPSHYFGATGSSIKIALPTAGGWGGGFVQNTTGVDASGFSKIQFTVDLSNLDQDISKMELKAEDTTGANKVLEFFDKTATSTDGNWKTYQVPIADFVGMDFAKFKAIGLWNMKKDVSGTLTYTPGTFYIDDIKFIQ